LKVESNVVNFGTLVVIDSSSFAIVGEQNWVDYLGFSLGDDKVFSIVAWATDTVGFSARGLSTWKIFVGPKIVINAFHLMD
jgi:hypothetical protein